MGRIDLHALFSIVDIGIGESSAARRIGWRESGRNVRQLLIHEIDKLPNRHVSQSTQRQRRTYRNRNTAQVEVQNSGIDICKRATCQRASCAAGGADYRSLAELVISRRAVPVNTGAAADDPFLVLTRAPRETKRRLEFFGVIHSRS